ncbi:hypothetical protein FNV43_RR16311 [Rhamnella rubrinervis]|uniref:Pathogen-related protein n=1 Tax=Rhamnella rubrinervis TaxID=2594499 RepID=A0A8K0GYK7_9ROSA|nr:hypothetical protein FNV43_RR16311 [Rhamnella rubrinervis]
MGRKSPSTPHRVVSIFRKFGNSEIMCFGEKDILDMATEEGSGRINIVGDMYRSFLNDEEGKIEWRYGAPPTYDTVNQLFEQGRTKEWPKGSLEETVQNAVKSWEMEISYKTRVQDIKTINPTKFNLVVNGREGLSAEETVRLGTYNALLKNSLPKEFKVYKAEEETYETSHEHFRTAFPRGFAWEVLQVFSGPPLISYKFRHWGFFEGPYKGHAPTGELVQFFGLGTIKVDDSLKVEDLEIYFDPAELFGGLLKGKPTSSESESLSCPFSKLTTKSES